MRLMDSAADVFSTGKAQMNSRATSMPFVTIIMPIRNESDFIQKSLGAVLAQDYPSEQLEVLVVDGRSDDGTRASVRRLMGLHPDRRVVLMDNPERIVPTALNRALDTAAGDIIIRVDGHCVVPVHYVRRCVDTLRETGAECVGGSLETVGETKGARAIALAQSSLFGVGGAAFRTGGTSGGYVDTLAFGAYRRDVFRQVGRFDEELVRNQDDEFNFRLLQFGGRIWMDPSIRVRYYSRSSLAKLWRQYFQYGFFKVRVIQKRKGLASWRHLVPGAFILCLVGSVLLASFTGNDIWPLLVAGPYLIANATVSLFLGWHDRAVLPYLPATFVILHIGYGVGFLFGLWRWRSHFRKVKGGGQHSGT